MIDSIDPAFAALVEDWNHDRELRRRVPARDSGRQCLGLAAIFDHPRWMPHGQNLFIRNDHLRWAALRDVPPGHFKNSLAGGRNREVNFGTIARASLRYGMPTLDFAHNAILNHDHRFAPIARDAMGDEWNSYREALDWQTNAREFAAFNTLSSLMTTFAYFAINTNGRPFRPTWWSHQTPNGRPIRPQAPGEWMPQPYAGFTMEAAELLYAEVTSLEIQGLIYVCPCGAMNESRAFRDPACGITSDGVACFRAICPRCRVMRRWRDDEALLPLREPWTSSAMNQQFAEDIASGLPLRAMGEGVYEGVIPPSRVGVGVPPGYMAHRIRYANDVTSVIYLPLTARIDCATGAPLAAGSIWARAIPHRSNLPRPGSDWRRLGWRAQWRSLEATCGGTAQAHFLRRVWFHNQAVQLDEMPELIFFPASLVSAAVGEIRPVELIWDFDRSRRFIDDARGLAAFPPIPLRQWNDLRIGVGEDLLIDASITDPRLLATPAWGEAERRHSRGSNPRLHRITHLPAHQTALPRSNPIKLRAESADDVSEQGQFKESGSPTARRPASALATAI